MFAFLWSYIAIRSLLVLSEDIKFPDNKFNLSVWFPGTFVIHFTLIPELIAELQEI